MKYYICKEYGTVYRLNGKVVEFCPIGFDDTFTDDEFNAVETWDEIPLADKYSILRRLGVGVGDITNP